MSPLTDCSSRTDLVLLHCGAFFWYRSLADLSLFAHKDFSWLFTFYNFYCACRFFFWGYIRRSTEKKRDDHLHPYIYHLGATLRVVHTGGQRILPVKHSFLYQFKTFCFNLSVFGLTRNVLLCLRQFLNQIKLFCFVPIFLGQNRKDLQLKRLFLHHIRTFWFDLLLFRLNRNIPLCLRQFLDQNKLFSFVPESLGQNGNDRTLKKKKTLDQIKVVCFRSDLTWTKSKCVAFVPIISNNIGTFVLLWGLRNMTKIWVYYIMAMRSTSLVWACRQLSSAARAYIPLSILRLPYSNYLST